MKFLYSKTSDWYLFRIYLLFAVFSFPHLSMAQSSNYWSGNFNEESSLLSGAVVGGDAGPSAIYYNPAGIAEIEVSKLSINASLFSYDYFRAENAWGQELDFVSTRFIVVPRFVSFMYKPKKNPDWSMEFAYLNNENYELESVNSVDKSIDVLEYLPGDERYNVYSRYGINYRDDWLGGGVSHRINSKLYLGSSMFVSFRSLDYSYLVDIEAGQPRTWDDLGEGDDFFTAKYKEQEYLKFNNYRLLWKFGMLYQKDNIRIGVNITTPSVNIFADSKRVMRKRSQSNITYPETHEPVPNYLISDYAEVKEVNVSFKSPLSIAAGFTWQNEQKSKTVYTTFEYFAAIDSYKMTEGQVNFEPGEFYSETGTIYDEWLTYIWGTDPVFNAAVGYRWIVKNDFMVLAGFRTDFNCRKDYDYAAFEKNLTLKGFYFDKYHITGGVTTKVMGQNLMAGLQYTLGYQDGVEQFINLSDPVEYNPVERTALQGTKQNNMKMVLNSLSFYFGATFNFGSLKD